MQVVRTNTGSAKVAARGGVEQRTKITSIMKSVISTLHTQFLNNPHDLFLITIKSILDVPDYFFSTDDFRSNLTTQLNLIKGDLLKICNNMMAEKQGLLKATTSSKNNNKTFIFVRELTNVIQSLESLIQKYQRPPVLPILGNSNIMWGLLSEQNESVSDVSTQLSTGDSQSAPELTRAQKKKQRQKNNQKLNSANKLIQSKLDTCPLYYRYADKTPFETLTEKCQNKAQELIQLGGDWKNPLEKFVDTSLEEYKKDMAQTDTKAFEFSFDRFWTDIEMRFNSAADKVKFELEEREKLFTFMGQFNIPTSKGVTSSCKDADEAKRNLSMIFEDIKKEFQTRRQIIPFETNQAVIEAYHQEVFAFGRFIRIV